MGLFSSGIPGFLISSSTLVLGSSSVAVETGTYKGSTTLKLSRAFSSVSSIEKSVKLFNTASKRLGHRSNVELYLGDSAHHLLPLIPKTEIGCLFWLDAHFSGGSTAGEQSHCPLMSELPQILSSRNASNTVILIDDSRGLIGKSGWPLLSELIGLLSHSRFSSIIIDDILIASSIESLGTIADDFYRSRTSIFERLGGRMSLVTGLVKSLGFITSTAFKIKHTKLLSKK